MNIIYLDIDGPVVTRRSMLALDKPDDARWYTPDPVCMGLLKYIIQTCDAKIYVHSSLARHTGQEELEEYLGIPILGFADTDLDRVGRIQSGMEKYKPEKYLVLDDYNLSATFGENFVQINSDDGITWEVLVKVLEYFGKTEPMILM